MINVLNHSQYDVKLYTDSEFKKLIDTKFYKPTSIKSNGYSIIKDKCKYAGLVKDIPKYKLCCLIEIEMRHYYFGGTLSLERNLDLIKEKLTNIAYPYVIIESRCELPTYHEFISNRGNFIFSDDKNFLFNMLMKFNCINELTTLLGNKHLVSKILSNKVLDVYICIDINCSDSKYMNYKTNKPTFYDSEESFNSISDLKYCLYVKEDN